MNLRRLLRGLVRRFPPVARRDRRIAALQARLAGQSAEWAARPSFVRRLASAGRIRAHERELGRAAPSVISRGKFWVYDFVVSHGVAIPEQYGRWDDPADIPWDALPDRVVVKAAVGRASKGVFPLQRVPEGWLVATHRRPLSRDELLTRITDRVSAGSIRGPFVAEEFLEPREPGGLPLELKVYAFYGEAPVVLISQSHDHRSMRAIRYRVVDASGRDLVDETTSPGLADPAPGSPLTQVDLTLPVPSRLDEAADVAARLTTAMRLPFARVDLYDAGGRIVFGEVTPRPGGRQWFGADVDELLGDAWERAEGRLANDLHAGAPPEPQRGLG